MARGGKKGKQRRGDWSDDEEESTSQQQSQQQQEEVGTTSAGGKQKSRKEKRMAKQQAKQKNKQSDDEEDDIHNLIDPLLLGGSKLKNQYGSDSEEEGEKEDEVMVAQPVSKSKKKNKGKQKKQAAFVTFDDSSSEEEIDESEPELEPEPEPEPENVTDLEEEMDNLTVDDSKSKKKKKEKKEKKSKKKKSDGDDVSEEKNAEINETDEEAKKAAKKAARKAEKAAKEERKRQKALDKLKAIRGDDENEDSEDENKDDDDDDEGVLYGAPDDHAWTDMSAAMKDAEKQKGRDGPDLSLVYGADGKKLSNKERKKLLKQREAEERAKAFEKAAAKASVAGAQFACSQTAVNDNDPQWMNTLDISIPSFNISAAGKILFKDASLNIAHGRRYGLVAPNGRGKSTLLKMIASRDLKLPPRVDFLYVEQEVVADNTPAVDAVLKADKRRWELLEEEKKLSAKIDAGDDDPKKTAKLQKIYEELEIIGAEAAESKARRILYGLGFDQEMQTKPTKMFSGGWRMRISLARALFIEPTLLMLDEPTNHLDLNAVIWLDDYLQKWKKTLLIVSHDQDFLNSVCQEMMHIEDLKVCYYKGDYDTFKKMEKTKFKQQQIAWEKQEKRLRELKRSGQSRAKAADTVKKSKREPGARSQKKINEAIASGQETATKVELIKRPREYTVKLDFPEVPELTRPVMEVNNVHFRYSEKNPVIFDCIDFGIDMDSRICVVGPNGAGKSTMLKLLTGEITPTSGEVRRNPRLRMGIYNQHFVDRLPMSKTPIEHLRDRFQDEDYQSIRNRLGKYGLEGHAHEVTMRDLSGGQKARVVFVELSLQKPHILLLDEPTNNLDIETIDALIDAINEFNGGIVVVTHDARLIEECECNLWVVEKQKVTNWTAGFEDYKENLLNEMEQKMAEEDAKRREKLEAAATARAKKLANAAKAK